MKRLLSIALGILLLSSSSAQKCPTISVKGQFTVMAGDDLTLMAQVSGTNTDVTYNWSISNGTISSGQGTSSITIDTKELTGTITATVDLGGLPRECASASSMTVEIIPAPKMIISANYTTPKALTASVQKFIKDADLTNTENRNTAFIYIYRGATTTTAQFNKMNADMKNSLEKNGIFSYQYKIADGGKKKAAFYEMYTMPLEAIEPKPTN